MLYTDLNAEILPDVPGCPDLSIARAVRDSAIEFFDTTLAYTVDQDPEPIFAGLDAVDLAIPTGTRLVQFLRAQIGVKPMMQLNRDQLMRAPTKWQTLTGYPEAIVFASETSVRLVPVPDAVTADPLYLRFAVAPTRKSTSIPDDLGERYYREIVAGAKSRLFLMPQRDWSNEKLGMAYRSLYERGMKEARLTESQDRISATRRVNLRRVV